jgi:hypothetical protein
LPNLSLKLRDLLDKNIIAIMNPVDRKGRIYLLASDGEEILKKIKEMEEN